ncbi:MAG: hypothetical protein ACLFOY_01520 [Desulfatibacillaceae bacterium]
MKNNPLNIDTFKPLNDYRFGPDRPLVAYSYYRFGFARLSWSDKKREAAEHPQSRATR